MAEVAKVLGAVAMGAALLVAPLGQTRAHAGPRARMDFQPHRAVYDITFDHATPGSGVADMSGRMVYEMTGSRCGGYSQSMRFVTRMTNQEGVDQINDLRTTSFEDIAKHHLRFSSSQYENQKLSEASKGIAEPAKGATFTEVKLTKPAKKTVKLPSDIYFPDPALARADGRGARRQERVSRQPLRRLRQGREVLRDQCRDRRPLGAGHRHARPTRFPTPPSSASSRPGRSRSAISSRGRRKPMRFRATSCRSASMRTACRPTSISTTATSPFAASSRS